MTRQVNRHQVLAVVCHGLHELVRCERLRPALGRRGWTVVYVTHLLSTWLRARQVGAPCVLVRRPKERRCPEIPFERTPEFIRGLVAARAARDFQHAMWDGLERADRIHAFTALAQWNGLSLGGCVATAFARAMGLPTVFFELGNIETKLFVDAEGVNARARISRETWLLDQYAVSEAEIEVWREGLIQRRRGMATAPQAAGISRINFWYALDLIGHHVMGVPRPMTLSVPARLLRKTRLWTKPKIPAHRPETPYLFLPLQVSKDSNLLLCSAYDNLAALSYAARRATDKGLLLVVKPHPAEDDARLNKAVARVCTENGHLLTTCNTTELLLGATEVVTINSAVGMEAKLLGKPVTILGESLYGAMDARQIAVLAMRRMVDFDPFGREEASVEVVDQILTILAEGPASHQT